MTDLDPDDIEYHHRRRDAERRMAFAARDARVRKAHLDLATLHSLAETLGYLATTDDLARRSFDVDHRPADPLKRLVLQI